MGYDWRLCVLIDRHDNTAVAELAQKHLERLILLPNYYDQSIWRTYLLDKENNEYLNKDLEELLSISTFKFNWSEFFLEQIILKEREIGKLEDRKCPTYDFLSWGAMGWKSIHAPEFIVSLIPFFNDLLKNDLVSGNIIIMYQGEDEASSRFYTIGRANDFYEFRKRNGRGKFEIKLFENLPPGLGFNPGYY